MVDFLCHRILELQDSEFPRTRMGARRHGQGALAPPPPEMIKSVFLLQMLSETSVDEVFVHYFENMSSAMGASSPDPHRGAVPLDPAGGLPSFRLPRCPPLEKKSCVRP